MSVPPITANEIIRLIETTSPSECCSREFTAGVESAKGILADKVAFLFDFDRETRYKDDVLRSDLPDDTKIFFLALLKEDVLQTGFGLWREEFASPAPRRAIEQLERQGFIWCKRRSDGSVCAVFHRMWVG